MREDKQRQWIVLTKNNARRFDRILKNLGFTSTNDRAFIPLFKKLGFLMDDGTPTAFLLYMDIGVV